MVVVVVARPIDATALHVFLDIVHAVCIGFKDPLFVV